MMALYADHDWSELEPPVRPIAAMIRTPHRAGWSIGDVGGLGPGGSCTWLFSGSNGEDPIRAEDAMQSEVWQAAVEQARSLDMLGRG